MPLEMSVDIRPVSITVDVLVATSVLIDDAISADISAKSCNGSVNCKDVLNAEVKSVAILLASLNNLGMALSIPKPMPGGKN